MDNQINDIFDVLVVGAGTSGMFVSARLLKLNKSVILLENSQNYGGQLNLYAEKHIHNIPLVDDITATEVMNKLYSNLNKYNPNNIKMLVNNKILTCKKNKNLFNIEIQNLKTNQIINISCKYIILATGKGEEVPNKLPIKNAENFENKTLLYSIKDKEIFKNKKIVIAGGGDSAIDWGCELSNIAQSIHIIHRREIIKQDNQQFEKFKQLCLQKKIQLKIPYSISDISGQNGEISNITLINNNTQDKEILDCDYLLPFYGLKITNTSADIFKQIGLKYSVNGIEVNYKTNETNIENIFAIGDCCNFEGKITNIPNCFNDAMRCVYCMCQKEKDTITKYDHHN